MSGDQGAIVIDVAATIGETDALSREAGERLATEVSAKMSSKVVLNFLGIGAVNSAFMAAFLLSMVERVDLTELSARVGFKGLSSRGGEVVRNSISRVRERVAGGHLGEVE